VRVVGTLEGQRIMAQQTTMAIYQGMVLECQHCYAICRYTDAAVRRNCPACGRAVANWKMLSEAAQEQEQRKKAATEELRHKEN
jgi:hypothetical protein